MPPVFVFNLGQLEPTQVDIQFKGLGVSARVGVVIGISLYFLNVTWTINAWFSGHAEA